jgi:hydroxymethylglutaryl-CoA lyase
LAIVANSRGAEQAASFSEIHYLGYPFSVSEVFQKRNTNRTIEDSLILVDRMQNLVAKQNKELVVYLSMAFGNPYQEVWHPDIVAKYTEVLVNMGIRTLALSDTIGVSTKETISPLFSQLIPEFNEVTFGAHLHTNLKDWKEKVLAAYSSGCSRFDTAIKGLGGCPMAKDELTGNMPTEKMLSFLNEQNEESSINPLAFESAYNKAIEVFH